MPERPYTILSCSISLDGYLGSGTDERLVLSNEADLDRVDRVRSECDAILVGAGTVRDDNPRLLVRDPARRAQRRQRGLAESPTKVTLTRHGHLDVASNFFATGDTEKIVYCPRGSVAAARRRLDGVATVVDGGARVEVGRLTEDLYDRGVRRLMVEGGGHVHTQFLTAAAADELHLVVAPFFVGTSQARRFVGDGAFPWNPGHRARLAETLQIGDVVLLRYALSSRFEESPHDLPHGGAGGS
ncbi:dihydrofolate reductase family protein [Nocardioides sp.]|uniref:RibD family protein n=1 Tax=Nocardioides sp. TaxID=35761 RepID=UPI002603CF1D|nr:dihydrofolate reductase family protein [Nocardioides sp.]MCW2736117.1 Deaminase [Nocardioides sp.]